MDWTQIEKDFYNDNWLEEFASQSKRITLWFKSRIEAELPPEKLTEEEKTEFYTTDLTANVKVNYEK
jgi:hypothetical protein